jgi:DNA-binding transcriptional ArsR family regulator
VLRIHFTGEDLTRVRVATAPDPLWEVLLSLHLLPTRVGALVFGRWRERIRPGLDGSVRLLMRLAPPYGYSPDFLTPGTGADDLDAGLDRLLSMPRRRIRAELNLLLGSRPPAVWMRRLADADPAALRQLGAAVESYYRQGLAPFWNQVRGHVDADRVARVRALLTGGSEQLLSNLHPKIRWQSPVLQVTYPVDRDIHLDGRGLLLMPSFFCWDYPVTLADPRLPPVLVYPVDHELGWAVEAADEHATGRTRRLAALLGRTRAAVLETTVDGLTTSALARRLRISPASASEHLSTLRDAGLTVARRHRNTVQHTVTPLGLALLDGGGGTVPAPGSQPDR